MCSAEYGKCDICGEDAILDRKHYYYAIKCECCMSSKGGHFEIVRYCQSCDPVPPKRISAVIIPVGEVSGKGAA